MTTNQGADLPPGLIIAAPASGSGKTLVTLGLLRHLRDSGTAVASAKIGPDYIDPAFHAAASGRHCVNLDPWAMRPATISAGLRDTADGAALLILEGVMGLFDGARLDEGSTAEVAQSTGWPVVLVVDAGAQGASAAAVVRGFAQHRANVTVATVIFNRVGSPRHAEILHAAMAADLPQIPVLGCVPRLSDLSLPERHLGLVQAREHPNLERFLKTAAEAMATHLDISRLKGLARPARLADDGGTPALPPLGRRIALARDDAFAFVYPHILAGWHRAGAEIIEFSPLADAPPDATADAVYLPGGYPELHAGRLAGNSNFLDGLRSAAERGATVLGECGGYMVLGDGLIDGTGARHTMAGLLSLETSFAERRLHLGYRRAHVFGDGPLGQAGALLRGHEFHYAKVVDLGAGDPLFAVEDATGIDRGKVGQRRGNVMGSFIHLIDREDSAA